MSTPKMKTLGLIGGTSWHSTVEYYQRINQAVNDHFGDNTNPPLVLFNLNQSRVHRLQVEDNWSGVADMLVDAGLRLQNAGAEAVIFCANTPHKMFELVSDQLDVPVLHIADATAKAIHAESLSKVCFIGTKFSMQEHFITGRFAKHGIEALVPEDDGTIEELHRIIQKELTFGKILPASKQFVLKTLNVLIDAGADGVVLGCTEFPLMISDDDLPVPVFDTTKIHSTAAVDFVLSLK
ncbi:amino acid racemase [bacterium]|nr:amino acid racemase [bacterium]